MKTKVLLIVIISMISLSLFSQDIIVTKGGKQIVCKLSGEDSTNVYYTVTKKRVATEASISRAEIQKIVYKTRLPYASTSDSIVVRNNIYFYKGKTMTTADLEGLLKTNNAAYKKYKSANGPYIFANILSGAGGGLIGWQLGTALGGGEANWGMAGVGGGLILLAIPVASIAVKSQKTAVNMYNKGVTPVSMFRKEEVSIGFASSGIGIRITF